MAFSQSTSRPFQTTMAALCLLLASGGFVGAGYVNNSAADAAILAAQHSRPMSTTTGTVVTAGFNSFGAQGLGVHMSFADTLISAQKPAAKQILDLTDPTANTPHLGRNVNAMRADLPEISSELISQVRKNILAAAYQGLGRPYVWGGTSFDKGWDCSGFVQWAYRQAGVALPRTEQWMPMVETRNPQPGDIVVQNPDGPNHWSHIGIYIGGGLMISALNPSVGTILHAPSDVSSSSSYFTMPAFAAADANIQADADSDARAGTAARPTAPEDGARPTAPETSNPAGTASANPGATSEPTPGATSGPTPGATSETSAPSTAPSTKPSTAPPVTTKPGPTPSSGSTIPPPGTTKPSTTPSAPEISARATKTALTLPTGEQSSISSYGGR